MADGREVDQRVFFDATKLGEPSASYVCWLDVMGSLSRMRRSIQQSANFIFKLHASLLSGFDDLPPQYRTQAAIYPVMDGAYIASPNGFTLAKVVSVALRRLAETFLNEKDPAHRFLIRGGVAYGDVYHGRNIQRGANYYLDIYRDTTDAVLLGQPVALAFCEERMAPPFGLSVHDTAIERSQQANEPLRKDWKWFLGSEPELDLDAFKRQLNSYYAWYSTRADETGYLAVRQQIHLEQSLAYFVR